MLYLLRKGASIQAPNGNTYNGDAAVWFIKEGDFLLVRGGSDNKIPLLNTKGLVFKSKNPEFPTRTAKAYKVIKEYPDSPKIGTLIEQSYENKEKDIGTYQWNGSLWRRLNYSKDFRCSNFPEYFEFLEVLYR